MNAVEKPLLEKFTDVCNAHIEAATDKQVAIVEVMAACISVLGTFTAAFPDRKATFSSVVERLKETVKVAALTKHKGGDKPG